MSDVALIYYGDHPHPAHRGFADAIGADTVSLDRYTLPPPLKRGSEFGEIVNGWLLPDYDVIISEGTRALYGSLSKRIGSGSTLIYLAGDQALYKLANETYQTESLTNRLISQFGIGLMKKLLGRYVDGYIAISDFTASYTRTIIENRPYRIAHPYIQPETYRELSEVRPCLDRNIATTVGTYSKYKGQDMLVEAWEEVRGVYPNAELRLVGSGYPSRFESRPGVSIEGYVEQLADVFDDCSLYIQPSRVDGFGVSVVEAMHAGLPAIVTTSTGSKSEVGAIDADLLAEPNPTSLARAIIDYFDSPITRRRGLSERASERGSSFDSSSRQAVFRSQFEDLLSEVESASLT